MLAAAWKTRSTRIKPPMRTRWLLGSMKNRTGAVLVCRSPCGSGGHGAIALHRRSELGALRCSRPEWLASSPWTSPSFCRSKLTNWHERWRRRLLAQSVA
jgi:hypothetical protein